MGLPVHTVDVIGGKTAQTDRILLALLPDTAIQAGNGGVSSIAVLNAGVYPGATIPTITINTTSTGSSAAATAVMKAVGTVTVTAGGTGYAVNDTITLTGGTGTKAVLTVTAVSGGVVTAATISATNGDYTVLPSNPVAQGSTSGGGSGATFTLTWGIKSITVGTAGTQYPADGSVTATVSGGSPTTAAVLALPVISTIAGSPAVLSVSIPNLPASYSVTVNPQQDATWYVDTKTTSGFKVHLYPRLAANSLAAGYIDIKVEA